MNRLSVRLMLAFLVVTLVAVGVVALFSAWRVGGEFRQFIARRDVFRGEDLPAALATYYQQHGNWGAIGRVLGDRRGFDMPRPPVRLADSSGRVVFDSHAGNNPPPMSPQERADALPLHVDGQTVGYLSVPPPGRGVLEPDDEAFVDRLTATMGGAALVAGAVGVALALVVSRTISAPLARLSDAARDFAAGRWERRVQPGGMAEIDSVASAFNTMADELQRAETLRRNMVADIAHELRTPLTVMQGSLRALLDGVYPLELREVAALYDETRLLSRLVNDLRELALADAGQLPLNLQPVDLAGLLATVADQFAAAAEEAQTGVTLDIAPALPPALADPDRVAQVLHNLLANALRHAPGGTIALAAAAEGGGLVVRVRDDGAGIAAADLPHVFDRFYRADEARARAGSGGTGLGLSIARAWVEAMGGQIGVSSTPGQGSTFWFRLRAYNGNEPG